MTEERGGGGGGGRGGGGGEEGEEGGRNKACQWTCKLKYGRSHTPGAPSGRSPPPVSCSALVEPVVGWS